MESVTVRIPKRKVGKDAVVEMWKVKDAVVEMWKVKVNRPKPKTTSIPAAVLDGPLAPQHVQDFFIKERGEEDRFRMDGLALFGAMFSKTLAAEWDMLMQRAAQDKDVRVYLAIEDSELATLPWELMTDDAGPLFLRPNPIVLRWSSPLSKSKKPLSDPWPIKILVVVGCQEAQASEIGVDKELAAIRQCLRAVDHSFDIELLDARYTRCNRGEFRARLDTFNPHILHFIGHATSDRKSAALKLWDREEAIWDSWPADELLIALQHKKRELRVVYLNACRTQAKGQQVTAASLADAFLKANVPAVIAMQADVHGDAANIGAAQFYERLAAGDTVDVAVEAGRARMLDQPDLSMRTRNPFCAVLTVQREPEAILRFRRRLTDNEQRDAIEECSTLKPVRSLFVNREILRRDLIATFFSAPPGKERSAAIFRGRQDAGKSWLAKWLLAVYAFRNCRVRYIEARHYPNWLGLMRAVVSHKKSGDYVGQPLPQKAQNYFYWTLHHVARGEPVPPGDPPARVLELDQPLTEVILNDNDAVSKIMLAFLEALRIAADGQSFLLVVDHWHNAGDHGAAPVTIADLKANLWDRIAEEHLSPVKLLLIMPPDAADETLDVEYPTAHWKHVKLAEIPVSEAPRLLFELYGLHFKGAEPSQKEKETFFIKAALLPKELDYWCVNVRKMFGAQR
jgi:hypothetical protein